VEWEFVSFPVASDNDHGTQLASYTMAETKWLRGEIKFAGRDTIIMKISTCGSSPPMDPEMPERGSKKSKLRVV